MLRLTLAAAFVATLGLAAAAADAPSGGGLYTLEQAQAGKAVYVKSCQMCHGADLQGTSAPAIAGSDFLTSSQKSHTSVADLQTIVTKQMPYDAPGTLPAKSSAAVMAFILASNCFAAGKTPFPETPTPALKTVMVEPQPGGKSICPFP